MRDISMFGYLATGSPVKSVDLQLVQEFAKQAASAFLGETNAPLNDTITKIAASEKLGQDQIELICQEANKLVNTSLFNSSVNKYTQFELADSSVILGGTEKVAHAEALHENLANDYRFSPKEDKAYFTGFTLTKTAGHDGMKVPKKFAVRAGREKVAQMAERLKDDIITYDFLRRGLEKQFVKTARNYLLPYGLKARRDLFPYISKFCKEAGLSTTSTSNLMSLLNNVMVGQGFIEKAADIKADPELISDNLDARIVNGTHPLYIIVKTIKDADDNKKLFSDRYNIIKDSMADYNADGAMLGLEQVKEL